MDKMKLKMNVRQASLLGLALLAPMSAEAAGLRGSANSMESQHDVALEEKLIFLERPAEVEELVAEGDLAKVEGNENFSLSKVSFPYARPEVKLFIERLAAQHREEIGTKLVVTSLTRPSALQPRNAHRLSVHPAGMAVDFRVPADSRSREWLEKALLGLEAAGVLDVTREVSPPHYHVAVFPAEYLAYRGKKKPAEEAEALAKQIRLEAEKAAAHAAASRVVTASTMAPAPDKSDRTTSAGFLIFVLAGIPMSIAAIVRGPLGKRILR